MKKILITGITGQDGLFLTNHLINKYEKLEIVGTSRQDNHSIFYNNLLSLGVKNRADVSVYQIDLNDYNIANNLISDFKPHYVYNLSGPSSVYESFSNVKNKKLITNIFDNLTSALIKSNNFARFFQASSSEMFSPNCNEDLNENSEFLPNSPYALAKLDNHNKVISLNKKYDWNIYSGITFNHESEFRKQNYLIMKIITAAWKIKNNKGINLTIGSLDYMRDWSHAQDIVEAINLLTEKGASPDYVIGSGRGKKIKDILDYVFQKYNLDWTDFVQIDKNLLRDGDSKKIISDPRKIKNELNWETKITFEQMLDRCIDKIEKSY
jgi:GDPmannose 4,6-dehydratase